MRRNRVSWTDTATGEEHVTEVTTANNGHIADEGVPRLIAVTEGLGHHADRVRIDSWTTGPEEH